MTERDQWGSELGSLVASINRHQQLIGMLLRKSQVVMAYNRDAQLTWDEQVASLEARNWWEERTERHSST